MGKGEHSAKLMQKIYAERMSQIEILDIVVGKAMTRGWSRCQFIQLQPLVAQETKYIYLVGFTY